MNLRRNRRAIDEEFAARVHEQTVPAFGEDLPHRVVIRDDGDDDVGLRRDFRQILAGGATEFRGEFRRSCRDSRRKPP